MADEQTATASDEGEEQAGEGGTEKSGEAAGKPPKTPPKTFGRRANNNLRTARRSLEAVEWQHDERASHLVAEANVLALLDLADAIRSSKNSATSSTDE
jgi:hypothetical protein